MPQQILNLGSEPGNTGDGDPLREAFTKTQSNFNELYAASPITDASLDHSDPYVAGTIAQALAACEIAGGGTVSIGPGIFLLSTSTLIIGANCHLIGSGQNATELQVTHQSNAVTAASGKRGKAGYWSIKNLSVTLPDSSPENAISTRPSEASIGVISHILINGGSQESWGIDLDGANVINVIDFIYHGGGSGIRWRNSINLPVNYGDSLIQNVDIVLLNPFTIGIQITNTFLHVYSTRFRINNMLLSRVAVHTADGIVQEGTVGIHMRNAARITVDHADIEHLNTAVLQESQVDGGPVATGNAFYQVHTIGCTTGYEEIGTSPTKQLILGGSEQFIDIQQLPSSNIFAEHNILGKNRVLTAVRPIEAHADSFSPRVLSAEDSGIIFTNKGATNTVSFQLPPANLSYSMEYEFHLATAGNAIIILPAPVDLIRPGQNKTGEAYISDVIFGQVLKIRNIDSTTWSTLSEQGVWTSILL